MILRQCASDVAERIEKASILLGATMLAIAAANASAMYSVDENRDGRADRESCWSNRTLWHSRIRSVTETGRKARFFFACDNSRHGEKARPGKAPAAKAKAGTRGLDAGGNAASSN